MAKKTRKDFTFEIEMPASIETSVENNIVSMKKDSKELKRVVSGEVKMKKEGNKIILEVKKASKNEKKKFGTAKSHIKNMIQGLEKDWEYELEICNVHFPITAVLDKAKSEIHIKNMLGEKSPRIIYVKKGVEVEIKAPRIKLKSHDLEAVGQTAADLEKFTKIRNRDRNKFQDGIFIIKKPGVSFI